MNVSLFFLFSDNQCNFDAPKLYMEYTDRTDLGMGTVDIKLLKHLTKKLYGIKDSVLLVL